MMPNHTAAAPIGWKQGPLSPGSLSTTTASSVTRCSSAPSRSDHDRTGGLGRQLRYDQCGRDGALRLAQDAASSSFSSCTSSPAARHSSPGYVNSGESWSPEQLPTDGGQPQRTHQ